MFIKIISAIVSAILLSLYGSWVIYTPISERLNDIEYHAFSGLFAYNFVPNFFILIILGVILSPLVDRVIYRKFKLKGIKGIFTIILAYLILGAMNGVFVSLFFLSPNLVSKFIFNSILSAMIFLLFQTIFQFSLSKITTRNKYGKQF